MLLQHKEERVPNDHIDDFVVSFTPVKFCTMVSKGCEEIIAVGRGCVMWET